MGAGLRDARSNSRRQRMRALWISTGGEDGRRIARSQQATWPCGGDFDRLRIDCQLEARQKAHAQQSVDALAEGALGISLPIETWVALKSECNSDWPWRRSCERLSPGARASKPKAALLSAPSPSPFGARSSNPPVPRPCMSARRNHHDLDLVLGP